MPKQRLDIRKRGIHLTVRIDCTPYPGFSSTTEYKAACGYVSREKNEFRKERQNIEVVTCEECLAKAHIKCGEQSPH